MPDPKISSNRCAVQSCKVTQYNKGIAVTLHDFPTNSDMRKRWLSILKTRCAAIDWLRSKICSKHFDHTCFDSQRRLKENAVPTMFPSSTVFSQQTKTINKHADMGFAQKSKIDFKLNKVTQTELLVDIKQTMKNLTPPSDFVDQVYDDLTCNPNASSEVQYWLLIKKQEHLIARMSQVITQNKKHVESLQKNIEHARKEKKDMEQSLESHKYIAKCLQEKHATLEEQIEILTAVESR